MELYILIGVIAAIGLAVIFIFNGLVRRRQMANNGWSDIDVQLKRRADLIPNLVTTVQGYAGHEKTLFKDIADRRSAALAPG